MCISEMVSGICIKGVRSLGGYVGRLRLLWCLGRLSGEVDSDSAVWWVFLVTDCPSSSSLGPSSLLPQRYSHSSSCAAVAAGRLRMLEVLLRSAVTRRFRRRRSSRKLYCMWRLLFSSFRKRWRRSERERAGDDYGFSFFSS